MKAMEIRKQLKAFFPFLGRANIILTDQEYDNIYSDDLRGEIIDVVTEGDCDDASRKLEYHIRDIRGHLQWPVGRVLLDKVAGNKINHSMIVAICNDGVFLVEPQAVWDIGIKGMQKMWKANKKDDHFYSVYI